LAEATAPGRDAYKAAAAAKALELVEPGMVVGLGSGTTARFFLEGLGKLVRSGVAVVGVPTSRETAELAVSLGVPITEIITEPIDIAVDGADEIDAHLSLIKGRGGALFREKVVAAASLRFIVIADEAKLVDRLGIGVLPVEVLPFLWRQTAERLETLCEAVHIRGGVSQPFITDNGNLILDLTFAEPIAEPSALAAGLAATVGVVEHGLFLGMVNACIVGGPSGVRVLGSVGSP
jgi:ribose 5-phosphate isomerase A